MIIALGSSIEGFKTLNFHKGLNILLAEQETNSEETESGGAKVVHGSGGIMLLRAE
ncbi:hypothetical protein Agau_C200794 [Agrobacterium tumefaciens F2]|nr:hypothetical protein Agau_C200794 [Agrobacterium tumefaciens F2]